MNRSDFMVKQGIQGLGVFTAAPITQNTPILKLIGTLLPYATRTSIQIDKHLHIEDSIGAHINHACQPSARVDWQHGTLVALRHIAAGEEITFDYNKNEDSLAHPFICQCCHKSIEGKQAKATALPA